MNLGCIFCQEPLVKYPNIKYGLGGGGVGAQRSKGSKKVHGGGKCHDEVNRSSPCPAPVVASKCGHLFHKECLKCYLMGPSSKLVGPNKPIVPKSCPFCGRAITLSMCIPIFLGVERSEMIQERLESMTRENKQIQNDLMNLRPWISKKSKEVKTLYEDTIRCQFEVDTRKDNLLQLEEEQESFGQNQELLKEDIRQLNRDVKSLSRERAKLLENIHKLAQITAKESEGYEEPNNNSSGRPRNKLG